jgi:hypothetical protein
MGAVLTEQYDVWHVSGSWVSAELMALLEAWKEVEPTPILAVRYDERRRWWGELTENLPMQRDWYF